MGGEESPGKVAPMLVQHSIGKKFTPGVSLKSTATLQCGYCHPLLFQGWGLKRSSDLPKVEWQVEEPRAN